MNIIRLAKDSKTTLPLLIIATCFIALIFPVSHISASQISVPFTQQNIQDSSLEIGQSQTRQPGNNGKAMERKNVIAPLFAYLTGLNFQYHSSDLPTETTLEPTNEIVANGTRKYQYMHCSNGGYQYYTNDDFKNPLTGFTHSSPDACAENGRGHMTALSDSAPQQQPTPQPTRTVYTPTYTPTYTNPTHCYTQYNTYGGYFDPTANTTCY